MASAPSASRSHDSTTPATGNSAAGSQPTADVTAITTHDDFLLELGQTLGGQAAVRPVDTLDAALEAIARGKRAQVLVIDARDVANVRAAVDAALAAAPRAVVLVFAEGAAERQLGAALKGSKVFAVLPTPVDARKTQAVMEAAFADAVANKAATAPPASAPLAPAAAAAELSIDAFRPQPAAADAPSGGSGVPRTVLIAGVAAAVVLTAGAAWYFMRSRSVPTAAVPQSAPAHPAPEQTAPAAAAPAPESAPAAPAAETAIVHGKVDELLEKSRLAMHERRFTEPAGDNALLYYRSAVAADPASAEARDGLQRVAAVLFSRFDEALKGGSLDEAGQTLASFKAAAPNDPRIGPLEQRLYGAEIAKALADGNVERAAAYVQRAQSSAVPAEQIAKWRADIVRHQEDAKVQRLAVLVEDRIREGKLVEGDDSARAYLQQLQTAAATNASTQRASRDLVAAELRKAREAALARNGAEQDRWLTEARAAGARPADIAAYQRDLASAQKKAAQAENDRLVQLARERVREGRLTDPAQDSAAGYLAQVQTADPNNAGLADAGHELAGKLLERARASVLAGRPADADLALARRWGADPKDVSAVQQLQSQPKQRGAPVDPASLAANLKRVRAPAPDYPESALAQHISGSVVLEYTVDARGETRDIHVVEANPPGVFDRAAMNAVKHWRYAPTVVNGSAVDVPVRTRLRFELPK
ncbi:MAG TPA: TonB family protein [Steroidobacteraceae bacterium]|nr:TonB family protein [Steroidobacteraceae bacterium]